ncbi:glycosyltransferase family 4 protein [Paenibacillus sp. IHBB 10380]|uniref:glycosyltransferase family 4 protein n=1 Tax=Paenibacillus sp. IHBB 10380 TaxID=1566358 RepID=UPI0005CFA756|nr:glycosyltransferase family 4 protein [Paenibacillus sp. IHBB 10380]AJS57465.1 glycosyl transferase [Paenibacillus sp. IHBB 10380]
MKVLFTFYVPSGGVETLNRLRCIALQKHGIEGHLLYLQWGAGQQNIHNIPTYITSDDSEISSLLHEHNYDAIVVISDYFMLERLRSLGYQGPLLFEAQGFGTLEQATATITEAATFLERYCSAVLLPQTSHLIEIFINLCPWLPRFIIPNLLETSSFTHLTTESPPYPAIAWVGRLEANKNWKEFLNISYQLLQIQPNIGIWMFQDANLFDERDRDEFTIMVQQLHLDSVIGYFSNIPHHEMPRYYSMVGDSGGFLLSTSILEGFGYAVAEAMSCKCPVLSTDSDGVRSFITHNTTGKFYPRGNITKAVEEGIEIMRNKPLRHLIRTQGQKHIASHFSPEQYVTSFRQMMNELHVF